MLLRLALCTYLAVLFEAVKQSTGTEHLVPPISGVPTSMMKHVLGPSFTPFFQVLASAPTLAQLAELNLTSPTSTWFPRLKRTSCALL